MQTKICSTCKLSKSVDQFSKASKHSDGLQYECRACNKMWRTEYYSKYPERNRARSIKQNYGLKFDELERMFIEQSGLCAICKSPMKLFSTTNEDTKLVARVDHCHTSGKIRGLLCHNCNMGLGHFQDKLDNLHSAIQYLEGALDD